jgi:hypothetical protein
MNLHSIVSGAVGAVNPQQQVSIQVSTGYTTNAAGKRIPTYAEPVTRPAQVQPMQYNDIVIADGLNIQGLRNAIYINGQVDGLVRTHNKGGDLITLADGSVWLVAVIVEDWPDWTKAIITMQNGQ